MLRVDPCACPDGPRWLIRGDARIRVTLVTVAVCLLANPGALNAQRPVSPADRATIDSFVVEVRDMAAWALITESAYLPVGAMLDKTGNVISVIGPGRLPIPTPDSALGPFRTLLVAGGRRNGARGIGLAYAQRSVRAGSARVVNAIVVEVEHQSGYRANVVWPYTRDDEGRPVFGASATTVGLLTGLRIRSR